jgi:peptidoglycan hydrolase-like protein with peptidoglycan-binding domain
MLDWLIYDGLTRQEFPQRLGWIRQPACIVLHSTEGGSWPGYAGGGTAPHFTVDPRARSARQHFPLTSAARALVAPVDGTHTNTGGPIQVEIIGTCDPRNGALPFVLDLDDGALGYLAGLLRAISDPTGIPLTSSVTWLPYPSSYGANGVRLTAEQWATYSGVLGHQHVPGNAHGDPGALNVARLLELAGAAPSVVVVDNPIVVPPPVPAGPVVIAPGVPAPPFPLPAGSYFGPKSGPAASVSGFYSHREDLRRWQQRMADRGWAIDPDGLYGDQTAGVAHAFQVEKGLGIDSLIGPETWGAAWTAPVTR